MEYTGKEVLAPLRLDNTGMELMVSGSTISGVKLNIDPSIVGGS